MTKALVLSGGGIKGAFQAGVVETILRQYDPDVIYGISTGALNAAFIADRAGRQVRDTGNINWPTVGPALTDFWRTNVRRPSDLIHKLEAFEIGARVLAGNLDGIVRVEPLKSKIEKQINSSNLKAFGSKGKRVSVGAVDTYSGQITYRDQTKSDFKKYVLASAAIPVIFPSVPIVPPGLKDVAPFVDGGIRDIAPLQRAVDEAATEIVVVACQPPDFVGSKYKVGNIFWHAERLLDILLHEILENDLKNKDVPVTIYRPDALDPALDVSIDDFNSKQILAMIEKGRRTPGVLVQPRKSRE